MTKKSAASYKVVKPVDEEEKMEKLRSDFEDAKKMFLLTIDTQIKTANRVDNLLNIRDYAKKFWEDDILDMDYYKSLLQVSIDTYKEIRKRSEEFELEEFMKIDIKDYYADLLPKATDIEDEDELARVGIMFLSLQPYGQKMMGLHQLIQQTMSELGIEAEEYTLVDYESEH